MDLILVRAIIKDFLGCMDGVSYDDDFGDIIISTCLVDTASNSEEFSFSTCYERSMMNSLDERLIGNMYMRNGCGNIVLDASIRDHDCQARN